MASTDSAGRTPSRSNSKDVPCDDTKLADAPNAIEIPQKNGEISHRTILGLRKPSQRQLSPDDARRKGNGESRRNSGLAPSNSTARGSHTTLNTDIDSSSSLRDSPSVPSFTFDDTSSQITPKKTRRWGGRNGRTQLKKDDPPPVPKMPFLGITTDIPSPNMEDLTQPGQIEFSKRGSMLLGGQKMCNANGDIISTSRTVGSRRKPSVDMLTTLHLPARVLSADDEILSHKVRSMYNGENDASSAKVTTAHYDLDAIPKPSNFILNYQDHESVNPNEPKRESLSHIRRGKELAGGIEDWEDVRDGDVDRYGFIVPRRLPSQGSSGKSMRASPEPPRIQRVSTSLQVASEAPRRQRSKIGRKVSSRSPARSVTAPSTLRPKSHVDRPVSSQSSYKGSLNPTQAKIRNATNRLPQNRDRRCVDEAGDMLTLPPGLADISELDEDSRAVDETKMKEWEREEKWRKMAKIVKDGKDGGGMTFEFDTKSPKLVERTWKGIPDRWRATAWHAFLSASARRRQAARTDDELIAIFKKLNDQGSPDDVQIDIDVPRTINSHIMFRRRYRGGQRLLFRVLHCLSIYFPDTGYVQGMAALAATLLCYFDEEMSFVMLVRLWQLRGLERLYQSGFEGLMQALDEFEKSWLAGGEVSAKLVCLSHINLIIGDKN